MFDRQAPIYLAALEVVRRLQEAGHKAYFVGGCVRDAMLSMPIKDLDIATSAHPEQISDIFGDTKFVGVSFGVCLVNQGDFKFEVATFRKDGHYADQRRPESVAFGTMVDDAMRRDFTVNAMYFDPIRNEVIDLVGGRNDMLLRRICCVGKASDCFDEDLLRMLRAVRFAAKLNFTIEPTTAEAIRQRHASIRLISGERVRDELTRMLMAPSPSRAFRMLDELQLLQVVLPEVAALKGVEQGRHHPEGDVFVHTMLCIDNLANRTPIAAWAMLLHDIGKPDTYERTGDNEIHFYGHDDVGARMVPHIASRLRFSNEEMTVIQSLVDRHMRPHTALSWGRSALRRYLGSPTIREELEIHRSDCLSSSKDMSTYTFLVGQLQEFETRHEPVLPPALLNGTNLIEMGYKPGPIFKRILTAVQDLQLEGQLQDTEVAKILAMEIEQQAGLIIDSEEIDEYGCFRTFFDASRVKPDEEVEDVMRRMRGEKLPELSEDEARYQARKAKHRAFLLKNADIAWLIIASGMTWSSERLWKQAKAKMIERGFTGETTGSVDGGERVFWNLTDFQDPSCRDLPESKIEEQAVPI